jgi:hypothetical protein
LWWWPNTRWQRGWRGGAITSSPTRPRPRHGGCSPPGGQDDGNDDDDDDDHDGDDYDDDCELSSACRKMFHSRGLGVAPLPLSVVRVEVDVEVGDGSRAGQGPEITVKAQPLPHEQAQQKLQVTADDASRPGVTANDPPAAWHKTE